MIVGIVGHARDKFTDVTRDAACREIGRILRLPGVAGCVSGDCHLGGVDKWAELGAKKLGVPFVAYPPKTLSWSRGYKPRNLQIAKASDEVHVIVVDRYPPGYDGQRFEGCYHCLDKHPRHVKSGGCWTGLRAKHVGFWHIISPDGSIETI